MNFQLFVCMSTILLASFAVVNGFWTDLSLSSSDSEDSNTAAFNHTPSSTEMEDQSTSPEGTQILPSNEELCGCYSLELVCTPFVHSSSRTCYYYALTRISNASYCDSLQFLSLGTGNLTECGLNASYVDSVLVDYAPKCYAIDPSYNSSLNNGVPGIQIQINEDADAIWESSSSSSDSDTLSSSSSSSEDGSVYSDVGDNGYIVFSVCFDTESVGGTQENGLIEFQLGDNTATCEYPDTLPNFCGSSEDEEVNTTSAATTSTPTTNSPTTPAPTTAAPTTSMPTTNSPTTASPTNQPTTSEPTAAPTFSICNSSDALNVAFLLDESGSVDETEWGVITAFVDRVAQYDLSPISYVSLFEYASLANYEQFLDWTPVETDGNRSAVTVALDSNRYNPAGQTETWDAVNRVLDEYWDYRFSCTDGCETRSDLMFLVTDGEPTGTDVCPDMIERMNQTDIDVVVILIDPNGVLDETKVSCLDVRDNEVDVIKLQAFDSAAFNEIEGRIRDKTCSGLNPAGPGERPENGTQWRYNGTIGLGPIPTRDGGGQGGGADPLYVNGDLTDEDDASWLEEGTAIGVSRMQLIIGATGLAFLLLLLVAGGVLYYYFRKRAKVKREIVSQIDVVETQRRKELEGNDTVAMNMDDSED